MCILGILKIICISLLKASCYGCRVNLILIFILDLNLFLLVFDLREEEVWKTLNTELSVQNKELFLVKDYYLSMKNTKEYFLLTPSQILRRIKHFTEHYTAKKYGYLRC